MRLIDLDQTIFVPIIDESKGGVKYEVQMTVAEMFDKFFEGVQPEIVDAIPVEWLKAQIAPYRGDVSDIGKGAHNATIKNLIRKWQNEQGDR